MRAVASCSMARTMARISSRKTRLLRTSTMGREVSSGPGTSKSWSMHCWKLPLPIRPASRLTSMRSNAAWRDVSSPYESGSARAFWIKRL